MNSKKICFIMCTDNIETAEKFALSIGNLCVPEGYVFDTMTVSDVASVYEGYNEAMQSSDAMYKVYVDEKAEIISTDFVANFLGIFKQDSKIGVIGFSGVEKMPVDMIMPHGIQYSNVARDAVSFNDKYKLVEAVDAGVIITRRDIIWRNDLFDIDYFRDVSECGEFKRVGQKIAVSGSKDVSLYDRIRDIELLDESVEDERQRIFSEYHNTYSVSSKTRRIALLYLKEIILNDAAWAFLQTDHDMEILDSDVSVQSSSYDDVQKVTKIIREHHLDIVFTFDFCPAVSDACMQCSAKYVSWIYDSPQQTLFSKQVENEVNYIFSFDRRQVRTTKEAGGKRVYHLPLATNISRYSGIEITKEDEKRFACDISFIGNLYTENLFDMVEAQASEKAKNEYHALIDNLYCRWDRNKTVYDVLSKETLEELSEILPAIRSEDFRMSYDEFFGSQLTGRYLSSKERIGILEHLAGRGIRFYTRNTEIDIPGVNSLPPLDYYTELPKAYYLSRINLNISLRSITSGIPLRIFDIMGVGGFVLSNYQPEMDEIFKIGKNIEVFHDLEELDDKIDYYLSHEDVRLKIAIQGYLLVKEKYTYEEQVKHILKQVMD